MQTLKEKTEKKLKVEFVKIHPKAQLPTYATDGAAGMDLTNVLESPLTLKPHERAKVPTGLIMILPEGYEGQVRPRSGLAAKHGITLTNCVGTVDSDYRGEMCCLMINLGNEPYTIQPGERIAQLVIAPVIQAETELVDKIPEETKRGTGGFGSTGK
ncbi:MAG: deoxyuridine 5'-triphosphate nucleotidohydrolase [Candidatus Melainabacteria bacterium RIFCSPHIGHO2_02_FULL_34_12]|nr:MAG: deoxyuridine 5'-triphosphate nucleotidohydrolase [Candidatus Melainabacteria bacterium RIFCSPHIGHO2_02_FULL_34_12]